MIWLYSTNKKGVAPKAPLLNYSIAGLRIIFLVLTFPLPIVALILAIAIPISVRGIFIAVAVARNDHT